MPILITILVVFAMLSHVNADESRLPIKEIQNKASESLATFSKLVTKQKNYREMGFESVKELERMNLGEPLAVLMVRLDHLKEYKEGGPNDMLSSAKHVIYPILVNNQVRSSVTIAEVEKGWRAVSFGDPTMVKLLTKIRMDSAETTRLPLTSYFIVQVPALNFYFLGYRMDKKLMLTPLLDDSRFEFKKGVSMSAEKVFTTILPAAKEHNGLPR